MLAFLQSVPSPLHIAKHACFDIFMVAFWLMCSRERIALPVPTLSVAASNLQTGLGLVSQRYYSYNMVVAEVNELR